jgi:cyanate permease
MNDFAARRGLKLAQGLDYTLEIVPVFFGVLFSETPNFSNNWIFFHSQAPSSSGEHSMGQAKP